MSERTVSALCVTAHPDLPEAHCLAGLAERGVEIRVLCNPDAANLQVLRTSVESVAPFEITRRFDAEAVQRLAREIADFQPEILHLFNNRAVLNGLRAARGYSTRIVVYRGNVGNVSFFDPLAWMRYLNPRIDRIVCVSDSVRESLSRVGGPIWHIEPEKLVTIHKGHDLSWYTQTPVDLDALGVPRDAFVVGCVANWRPRKGVEILLDACERLDPRVRVHLVLVGDMGTANLAQRLAVSPIGERVHVLGQRADAPAVAAAFDVAVLPAVKREGLPKTVIEAMAYGVATVASRVGGVAEIIEDGVSGLIVPPGDARALAEAITRLHDDSALREQLGRRGRERIRVNFRIEDTIEKTAALYRSLVALEPRPPGR